MTAAVTFRARRVRSRLRLAVLDLLARLLDCDEQCGVCSVPLAGGAAAYDVEVGPLCSRCGS